MPINENTLEQAIISELQEKGYEYLYGPDIYRDYHEVILRDYFDSAMFKINPKITADIVEETYKSIKNLGLLKLEDINAAFHKYLIEGIPISYRLNDEQATFTVHLIDFEKPESNDFKVVNQYTIIEYKNKRPDILIFINGIPMESSMQPFSFGSSLLLFKFMASFNFCYTHTCVHTHTVMPLVPSLFNAFLL